MSLSSALNTAMSGLTAAGRASSIVSENVSNAMTPGYGRRSLGLASNSATGAGVRIVGVQRNADPGITANRRGAEADKGAAKTVSDFQTRLSALIGQPGDAASVGARLAKFESNLITAASRPDSTARLDAVAVSAADLAQVLRSASKGVQVMRSQADTAIAHDVKTLNKALSDIQKLNVRITAAGAINSDASALEDQRQILVDKINVLVPVNVIRRDHDQIALYSDGGAILLDGQAATLGFDPAHQVTAQRRVGDGTLSGLTINDVPVRVDSTTGALRGGTLGARFLVRDELGVAAQTQLDATARDLIERFEAPALDPTRVPGDPGLFTDGGSVLDPATEIGLAGRIAVNGLVDAQSGGESWRLREGLGAGSSSNPGDARLLRRLSDALTTRRTPASGDFGAAAVSAKDVGSALLSRAEQDRSLSDQRLSFAASSFNEVSRLELSLGVDTDAELQSLMVIEKVYAANARILSVVDDMMQTLLRL